MSAPEPMTEERLKEIEARAKGCKSWDDIALTTARDVPALVAEVRRLQRAMVEIRQHVAGSCGHRRQPHKIGACLTAIRDLTFVDPSSTPEET